MEYLTDQLAEFLDRLIHAGWCEGSPGDSREELGSSLKKHVRLPVACVTFCFTAHVPPYTSPWRALHAACKLDVWNVRSLRTAVKQTTCIHLLSCTVIRARCRNLNNTQRSLVPRTCSSGTAANMQCTTSTVTYYGANQLPGIYLCPRLGSPGESREFDSREFAPFSRTSYHGTGSNCRRLERGSDAQFEAFFSGCLLGFVLKVAALSLPARF